MSPRLAFALDAAYKAGRSTLAHFCEGTVVEIKKDFTPVTVADKNAELLIRELVRKSFPKDVVFGEEQGGAAEASTRWVVDPIDGTKSFVSGVPLYATLLSYEEGGEVTIGVCYFPALDEMLYAERGQGAFFNGRAARVSTKGGIDGAVMACGGLLSMVKFNRMAPFLKLSERTMATRTWSDAYGHALVATGRIEAMVDPVVNPWDISALSLIVREAGGAFTDMKGNLALAADALSSNGLIHAELLEAFTE